MMISTIDHDEATIQSFVRDPEFAELYLQTVLTDGDADEISHAQWLVDEARTRGHNANVPSLVEA